MASNTLVNLALEMNLKSKDEKFSGEHLMYLAERNQDLHTNTPNSSLLVLEDLVNIFGVNGVLDLSDSIDEFELFSPTTFIYSEEDDSEIELYPVRVRIRKAAKGAERVYFDYKECPDNIEMPYGDPDGDDAEAWHQYDVRCNKIYTDNASAADYEDINKNVLRFIHCIELEIADGNREYRTLYSEFHKDKTWYLSFEPSMVWPDKGYSLIIRQNQKPKSDVPFREFRSFKEALLFREKLHDKYIDTVENHLDMMFSDTPCDIAIYQLDENTKSLISRILLKRGTVK